MNGVRPPTVDELVDMVASHWDPANPDKLRDAVSLVRDAVLLGAGRAHLRRGAANRTRARRKPHQVDEAVLARVARAGGMDVARLLAHDRSQTVSHWRFVAMVVLRRTPRSWNEVAAATRRSRSDVIHGVRRIEAEAARDRRLAATLKRLAA